MQDPPPSPEDGLKRMVRMATIFQSPEFQNPKKKIISEMKPDDAPTKKRGRKTEQKQVTFEDETQPEKKRKIGPYDPKVYALVEEIRAETEPKPEDLKQASLEPQLEEGEIQTLLEDLELSDHEPMVSPSKVDYMVCPLHLERLTNVPNAKGWKLLKCPTQPCLLFCGQNEAEAYMTEVYRNVHPDICDRWGSLLCFCGYLPALRQSRSTANPGRLYLNCRSKPYNRCKFFRWADQPIKDKKVPLNVYPWLTEDPPAPESIPPANQENRHYRKEQWFTKDAATLQPSYSPKPYWGQDGEKLGYDLFCCAPHWTDIYDAGPTIGDPERNPPAPPPPKYSENFADYLKRQDAVHEDSLGLF